MEGAPVVTDVIAEVTTMAEQLSRLLPHSFEVITALPDGTPIPVEALSDDHTVGPYGKETPRKMRENAGGLREIEIADLLPQIQPAEVA
jgi:hypothetical protein